MSLQPDGQVARLTGALPARPIRVVVCDDSPFMRRMIRQGLEVSTDIEVVGLAANAREAIELCNGLTPDILTLDLQLPDLDGIRVLQHIRNTNTRVIVVSAFTELKDGDRAVEALTEGAVDILGKPTIEGSPSVFFAQLLDLVRDIAQGAPYVPSSAVRAAQNRVSQHRLVIVGASTGGPRALHALLPSLPEDFPAPIVIVQHIPSWFNTPFAHRLDSACKLQVVEAVDGAQLTPGVVHVAVPDRHLHIEGSTIRIRAGGRVNGLVPAVDVTMIDAAETWGSQVTGIILTGIGRDGREGARAIHAAGGRVIAEHQRTCAVYGMPRSVVEAELADAVVPLDELAQQMMHEVYT